VAAAPVAAASELRSPLPSAPSGSSARPGRDIILVLDYARYTITCMLTTIEARLPLAMETGTYDGLDERKDGDGEVTSEEGVGEEAAEEAEQEGGAHEVGDDVGGRGAGQVHGARAREVGDEVHGDAHGGQPLAQLDAEGQRHRHPTASARLVRER